MVRDAHYRLLFLFLITAIGIGILFPLIRTMPVHAHASVDPIIVDSRSDTLNFPKTIDFELKAHDSQSVLTRATLYLKYNSSLSFQQQQRVSAPTQGQSETFSWQDDLTGGISIFPPAGTQISYYWIIQDVLGNSHTDTIQTFEVIDNRFQWQHLSQGLYQVNWYNQQNDFGQAILDQVTSNAQRITQNVGGEPQKQINLWVYASEEDFKGSLPPDVHEWVGGIAFPAINQASIVVASLTDTTLSRDMPHEITHLIFHQLVTLGIAPTWFDEGLAVYNQVYHEYDMGARFRTALTTHSLLELSSISSSFPADSDTAYLAYAQSWQLLDYMYKTFGQDKMHTFIQTMHSRFKTFDNDMQQALGLDSAHLENQWHVYLGQPTTISQTQQTQNSTSPVSTAPVTASSASTPLLMVLGFSLIFIPILGFGGLLVYQRRTKQKTRMQALQPQQQGPFPYQGPWYPPVNPSLPYDQSTGTSYASPNIHTGNYTSPTAYAAPTTQKPAILASTPSVNNGTPLHPSEQYQTQQPQNFQGQPYPWYPPYSSHPQYPQPTPYPPQAQQPDNAAGPQPPQAPQE